MLHPAKHLTPSAPPRPSQLEALRVPLVALRRGVTCWLWLSRDERRGPPSSSWPCRPLPLRVTGGGAATTADAFRAAATPRPRRTAPPVPPSPPDAAALRLFPRDGPATAAGGTFSSSPSSAPSPLASEPAGALPTLGKLKHAFSACYLPEVAEEQGWDQLQAIDSAIRKAGWTGRISEDLRRAVRLRRYQSRACEVTWEEYAAWRERSGSEL